jgi:hypothetical protein
MNREALKLLSAISIDNQILSSTGNQVFTGQGTGAEYADKCKLLRSLVADLKLELSSIDALIPVQ